MQWKPYVCIRFVDANNVSICPQFNFIIKLIHHFIYEIVDNRHVSISAAWPKKKNILRKSFIIQIFRTTSWTMQSTSWARHCHTTPQTCILLATFKWHLRCVCFNGITTVCLQCKLPSELTLILRRSRTGTVRFYTSTRNKRAARPKLYTKSLTRDLKLMYSRLTLVRISIKL